MPERSTSNSRQAQDQRWKFYHLPHFQPIMHQGFETKKGPQDAGLFRNVNSLTLGYSVLQKPA
jgi:hypothetical protein